MAISDVFNNLIDTAGALTSESLALQNQNAAQQLGYYPSYPGYGNTGNPAYAQATVTGKSSTLLIVGVIVVAGYLLLRKG